MEDDDDFVFCGTPLPDIEEAAAQKKSNRQFEVRDEKGRQRFHGAFTGGFSAGYFNTVGSKEGWVPSSFVSSRTKGSEKIVQRPEDFMDSEDFNAFGIAPRKMHTTANFQDASDPSFKRKVSSYSDAVIPGEAPLKGLIQPTSDSIGIRMLMKLGWKPGQGIGPRTKKKKQRRVEALEKISDTSILDSKEDDPNYLMFTFAPKDTYMLPYTPKEDYHGIGYTGLSTKSVLSVSSSNPSSITTKSWLDISKKKISITGKAFGIGALEEDDDDDVYGHDDMSQYDFSDMGVNEDRKDTFQTATIKCNNQAKKILEGFILSTQNLSRRKKYFLPQVPANFKPMHEKSVSHKRLHEGQQYNRKLTAEDRSLILGEKKFISLDVPKVVRPQLEITSGQNKQACSTVQPVVSDFRPFLMDVEKQKRYEEYLKIIQIGGNGKIVQSGTTMTEWEKQQELEEFARAASLYQPLSRVLESRFVSSSQLQVENVIDKSKDMKKVEKECKDRESKSHSSLSRTKYEWHPASLLCRRFNVPNPYPNSTSVGILDDAKKSASIFDGLSFEPQLLSPVHKTISEASIPKSVLEMETANELPDKKAALESEASVSSTEVKSSESESKPPMDFFKAIFQDSSSNEETSSSEHEEETPKQRKSTDMQSSTEANGNTSAGQVSINSEASVVIPQTPKATFGVFANLDLDMLKVKKKSPVVFSEQSSHSNTENNMDLNFNQDHRINSINEISQLAQSAPVPPPEEQFYGPRLPPPGSLCSVQQQTSKFSKLSHSKHSKHKSKHKHHKHSKKKNKKHKRKHSHRSDSSDLEEIESSVIVQKLKDIQSKAKKFRDH